MKKLSLAASLMFLLPAVAFAQTLTPLQNLITSVGRIVGMLVPILIGIALIVFFWGLVQYVWKQDRTAGKATMLAGLISLFVMVSVWGIIALAGAALGIGQGGSAPAPGIPGYNSTPSGVGMPGYNGCPGGPGC